MSPALRIALASSLTLVLIAGAGIPAARAANGVIDLSWGTCSPVVAHTAPVSGAMSLVASVLGNDQAHLGYIVNFQLGAADDTVPDAWRFDAAGCPGLSRIAIHHLPRPHLALSCPAFGPSSVLQIREYEFFPPGVGFPTTAIRGRLASVYPAGVTSVPSQRYFLAEFLFDHSISVAGPTTPGVTCGGFETPMFVRLIVGPNYISQESAYVRLSDGVAFPFDAGNTLVTVGSAVPAASATWGKIKSAYRR